MVERTSSTCDDTPMSGVLNGSTPLSGPRARERPQQGAWEGGGVSVSTRVSPVELADQRSPLAHITV